MIGGGKPIETSEAVAETAPEGAAVAGEAARKRAAVELIARHERSLRRTAQRYSICADDADDAYQRALEILLVKAPTDDLRELIRWMTTVVKHEALKVRQSRERTATPSRRDEDESDWVALIPAEGDGPAALVERREAVARSREALQALKPQELRALTLLAEGYSYEEIGAMTGFSQTRVNRCLAEGRERFRAMVSRGEDGSRCKEMAPLLSAFCDGRAGARDTATVREHLRACAPCRAALRAYRAAPRAAAALAPLLPVAASRSLLERAQEALHGLYSRLPGQGGAADTALSGMAAGGGTHGTGAAALAKVLAACVGTAGGAAACVATGVVPAPLGLGPEGERRPAIERPAAAASGVDYAPAPAPEPAPAEPPKEEKERKEAEPTASSEPVAGSTETGAVEYTPPPAPPPAPAPAASGSGSSSAPSGSVAGEFGP